MNDYKLSNKFCVLLAGCCLFFTNNSYAIDFEGLQSQCAELGFKIKTLENGKCVLKLRKKVIGFSGDSISNSAPVISQSIEAANQRNYERQQKYAKDAEIEQKSREIEVVRQQQAIQQQQAQQRQQEPSFSDLLGAVLLGAAIGYGESKRPVQTYQPPIQMYPLAPTNHPTIKCDSTVSSFSNSVSTTCR